MLRWDPEARCVCTDAIQHAYFEQLHCPEDEPVREPLDNSEFELEERKVTVNVLRGEIFRETLYYYPIGGGAINSEASVGSTSEDVYRQSTGSSGCQGD